MTMYKTAIKETKELLAVQGFIYWPQDLIFDKSSLLRLKSL